ncbi:hypothetical protein NP233_g12606 [Leucocoprinus birnbaumii]|uniref:Protein kinase domain-containing protein n=1 Tax=Leucocoprinus birnbaumii TaxID=56174 RepID=A0AAD5VIA9_9AGAR|nr:hypothetical protein NP233_g12606 [Leucocoprinus birnbaumii]
MAVLTSLECLATTRLHLEHPPLLSRPDLRLAAMKDIRSWWKSKPHSYSIFLLNGTPSTGHTSILHSVVGMGWESPFCEVVFVPRTLDCRHPSSIVASISYCIAAQDKLYMAYVSDFVTHNPNLLNSSMLEQFRDLIDRPFGKDSTYLALDYPKLLVVDMSDRQAGEASYMDLVNCIAKFSSPRSSPPIFWLIATSLSSQELSTLSFACHCFSLVADTSAASRDVEKYLHTLFEEIRTIYLLENSGWPPYDQFLMLSSAADESLDVANIMIRYIGDPWISQPQSQLTRLVNLLSSGSDSSQLPPFEVLTPIYNDVMARIPSSALTKAKMLLISILKYPQASLANVCTSARLELDDAYVILQHLHPIMDVPSPDDARTESIEFHSPSLRHFLMDSSRSGPYYISGLITEYQKPRALLSRLLANPVPEAQVGRLDSNDAQLIVRLLESVISDDSSDDKWEAKERTNALHLFSSLLTTKHILPNSFELVEAPVEDSHLSGGVFSDIYKGRLGGGSDVCIKKMRFPEHQRSAQILKAFFRELALWCHLRHPNILPFYGFHRHATEKLEFCLVSPFQEYGNILSCIKIIPEIPRIPLLLDLIYGLEYLHSMGIVHCDLKPSTVVISRQRRAMLMGFGISRLAMDASSTDDSSRIFRWTTPEQLRENAPILQESDMWNFGSCCLQVLTGEAPFNHLDNADVIFQALLRGKVPAYPKETGDRSFDSIIPLLNNCWDHDPAKRPTAKEARHLLEGLTIHDSRPSFTPDRTLLAILKRRERIRDVNTMADLDQVQSTIHRMLEGHQHVLEMTEGTKGLPSTDISDYLSPPGETRNPTSVSQMPGGSKVWRLQDKYILVALEPGETSYERQIPFLDNLSAYLEATAGEVRLYRNLTRPSGLGRFYDVWKGEYFDDKGISNDVAIKGVRFGHFPKSSLQEAIRVRDDDVHSKDCDSLIIPDQRLIRETVIWQRLKHPNILPFIGLLSDLNWSYVPALISPWCRNGTIREFINAQPHTNKPQLMLDIANGLRYLHEQDIVHGGVIPPNILISNDGHALLADFAQSRILDGNGLTKEPSGVFRYESLSGFGGDISTRTMASDIYRLSITFSEVRLL